MSVHCIRRASACGTLGVLGASQGIPTRVNRGAALRNSSIANRSRRRPSSIKSYVPPAWSPTAADPPFPDRASATRPEFRRPRNPAELRMVSRANAVEKPVKRVAASWPGRKANAIRSSRFHHHMIDAPSLAAQDHVVRTVRRGQGIVRFHDDLPGEPLDLALTANPRPAVVIDRNTQLPPRLQAPSDQR